MEKLEKETSVKEFELTLKKLDLETHYRVMASIDLNGISDKDTRMNIIHNTTKLKKAFKEYEDERKQLVEKNKPYETIDEDLEKVRNKTFEGDVDTLEKQSQDYYEKLSIDLKSLNNEEITFNNMGLLKKGTVEIISGNNTNKSVGVEGFCILEEIYESKD